MSERFLKYETEDVQNGTLSGVNSNGVLKNAGGGSSVQTDWNQTDETQPDYIKNRPFGTLYGVQSVDEIPSNQTGNQDSDGNYVFTVNVPKDYFGSVGPCTIELYMSNGKEVYENVRCSESENSSGGTTIFETDGLPFSLKIDWYNDSFVTNKLTLTHTSDNYLSRIAIYDNGRSYNKLLDISYLDIDRLGKEYFARCYSREALNGMSIVYNSEHERYEPSYNVILKSSTSGSSKKFKLTVDDSGTLSATEVTT